MPKSRAEIQKAYRERLKAKDKEAYYDMELVIPTFPAFPVLK